MWRSHSGIDGVSAAGGRCKKWHIRVVIFKSSRLILRSVCCKPFCLLDVPSQLKDWNSSMLSSMNLKSCMICHTEEKRAQSSTHDCTADHEMCSSVPQGFRISFMRAGARYVGAGLCLPMSIQTPTHFPPWLKLVQVVQLQKCRHGQGSEGA